MSNTATAIVPDISPRDTMFEGDADHYLSVGQSALQCIRVALTVSGKTSVERILDFGSGYGRVMRALRSEFPQAKLVACDISSDAVEFCSEAFGAEGIVASAKPAELELAGTFDLIWVGTLFTNLDQQPLLELLRIFDSRLEPGGVLLFTTHGPFVANRIRSREYDYGIPQSRLDALIASYDSSGFGYENYPQEVLDRLELDRYGISLSKPAWICSQLESFRHLHLLSYIERGWDRHQDVVACVKT